MGTHPRLRRWPGLIATSGAIALVALLLWSPGGLKLGNATGPSVPGHSALTAATLRYHTGNWTLLNNGTGTKPSPPPRQSGAMVYDPIAKEFVLFGGYSSGPLGDTWIYARGAWSDLTSHLSTAPSARWYFGMAWDGADHVVLLFGGRNNHRDFNDTWAFNGSAWRNLSVSHAPPPMTTSRFVYDQRDNYVWLFRGNSIMPHTPGVYAVTWAYRNGTWTNLTSTVRGAPTGTNDVNNAVYDPSISAIVLLGANSASGSCSTPSYTWLYANGTFRNVTNTTSGSPPLALGSRMLGYDPAFGGVVLYGGSFGFSCSLSSETWVYHARAWTQHVTATTPGPLWDGVMAANPAADSLLLFSGNTAQGTSYQSTDTWRFTP